MSTPRAIRYELFNRVTEIERRLGIANEHTAKPPGTDIYRRWGQEGTALAQSDAQPKPQDVRDGAHGEITLTARQNNGRT